MNKKIIIIVVVALFSIVTVSGATLFYLGQTATENVNQVENVNQLNSNYPLELKDYSWFITNTSDTSSEYLVFGLRLNLTDKANVTWVKVEGNFTMGSNRFQQLDITERSKEVYYLTYAYPAKYGNDVKIALTVTNYGTDEYGDQKTELKTFDLILDSSHFKIQPFVAINDLKAVLNRESGVLNLTLTVEVLNWEEISSQVAFDAKVNFYLLSPSEIREVSLTSNVISNQQNSTVTWVYKIPTDSTIRLNTMASYAFRAYVESEACTYGKDYGVSLLEIVT